MEANVIYYCFHKHGWRPLKFLSFPREERAWIIACVMIKTENDKKKEKEIKQKSQRGR